MAIANASEDPASVENIAVALGVKVAVSTAVVGVDFGVLGMNVEKGALGTKFSNGHDWVDALPPEMAWVEVGSDPFSIGSDSIAKLQQSVVAVADKARVHFDAELDFVLGQVSSLVGPVGKHNALPLPFKNVAELVGPSARHPVGVDGLRAVAWAAAEAIDGGNSQEAGELDSVAKSLVMIFGNRLVGVDRVAMNADGAEHKTPPFQVLHQVAAGCNAVDQVFYMNVARARVGASTKFDGLDAFGLDDIKGLIQGFVSK